MGKRDHELDAIRLYADGMEISDISKLSRDQGWYVSENSLRAWKKRAGTEWDDARAAARKTQLADMEDVGSRIRRSREIASQLMGSSKDQSAVGLVLNQTLQTMLYDLMNQMRTSEINPDEMGNISKLLVNLSLVLGRTEQAASMNLKREQDIRKEEREKALQDAAAVVGETARAQGMDDAQAEFWMKKILGVV